MSVVISLRDAFEAVTVPGDFVSVVNTINVAASNGMKLCVVGSEYEPVAINIANINSIRPEDADALLG